MPLLTYFVICCSLWLPLAEEWSEGEAQRPVQLGATLLEEVSLAPLAQAASNQVTEIETTEQKQNVTAAEQKQSKFYDR